MSNLKDMKLLNKIIDNTKKEKKKLNLKDIRQQYKMSTSKEKPIHK